MAFIVFLLAAQKSADYDKLLSGSPAETDINRTVLQEFVQFAFLETFADVCNL